MDKPFRITLSSFTKLINDMRNIKMTMPRMQLNSKFVNNMLPEWGRFVTVVKLNRRLRDSNYDQMVDRIEVRGTMQGVQVQLVMGGSEQSWECKSGSSKVDKVLQLQLDRPHSKELHSLLFLAGGQDNAVDEDVDEQPVQDLALNVDNVFQADDCDAFVSDVDEDPTAQTMFMANLSSADPVYDEASPSNDSDILSETPQSVSTNKQDKVVNASLTAELATYKKQVELYERRAKFKLTEREQKIDEQLRIVITDCNIKEENLKRGLHSKENKYLEEFLDMKALKEKVGDRLFKQDQSLQTVHMLCKPKPHYDEQKKVAIGYKNPLYLTRAKQVQPALYNGHEIIKTHHDPAIVHDSEDTLEIAETTRKQMNEKNERPSDLIKMKAEALKEQTTASRPIKVLMVKHDEIEQKNLLIINDNLIVDCLSKEVFYIATNSELTVSRFTEMHDAHTVIQARCLELEAELSKLRDKVLKDDHT
ncbi:hypothetical protein Tco_0548602 [Tanacetum coccineum]